MTQQRWHATGGHVQPGLGRGDPESCRADAVPVDGTFYSAEEERKTEGKNLAGKVGFKAKRKMLLVRGMK